ncbi:uncharacterized protein LOC133180687 [Saccostrea echinata]|uniref:uncharacterized protein LOC133180687 n=1 Tax=Saccostrea echinata TaxID=191078 RepID=UPI002A82E390|nr:uncharacterized protein LOC133180687 [Saccostrea echinata]
MKENTDPVQQIILSLTVKINMEDVIKSLCESHVIEMEKREVGNVCGLKLMPTPVLHKSFTVQGVSGVDHISFFTPDRVWISDSENNLILTNKEGGRFHHLRDVRKHNYGVHTMNTTGDLIYRDREDNIIKLSKDNNTKSTLIEKPELFIPICVYCSRSNADILVGMIESDTLSEGKVNRYNSIGQYLQTIKHDNIGQKLYSFPRYITENHNRDVIVSDTRLGVVVTDHTGRHRFTYKGPLPAKELQPRGICTDALSYILVCDDKTNTIHKLNKDGQLMSLIPAHRQGIRRPRGLGYDYKAHLLWVGSSDNNEVCMYRYIKRENDPGEKV